MHYTTKQYRDLPAAHRQPNHTGHCRLIHGHNWGFDITFSCDTLDECGFVIDMGNLGCVRRFLHRSFDHTLLLNADDPLGDTLIAEIGLFATIILVPNCGMEGLARWVFDQVDAMIGEDDKQLYDPGSRRGLEVTAVTCWEDSKNSSTYERV